MRFIQKLFYRKYGARRLIQFVTPKVFTVDSLPRNALLHYCNPDFIPNEYDPNIDSSQPYFNGYNKKIEVCYLTEITSKLGNPIKKPAIIKQLTNQWHRDNKEKFRFSINPYYINQDLLTLVVINYNYLYTTYRYVPTPMTDYNRWMNVQHTLWSTINEACEKTKRNQYVFVDIPKDIPARSTLEIFKIKSGPALVKLFETPERFFILEMWKWLDETLREKSLLSVVSEKNFSNINILFRNSRGLCSLVNLGYLNSWIKGNKNSTDANTVQQFNNRQIKMFFLKFLMMLNNEGGFLPETVPEEVSESSDNETKIDEEDRLYNEEIKEEEKEVSEYLNVPLQNIDSFDLNEETFGVDESTYRQSRNLDYVNFVDNSNISKPKFSEVDDFQDLIKTIEDGIEEDLEQLEQIDIKKREAKGVKINIQNNEVELIEPKFDIDEIDFSLLREEVYQYKTPSQTLKQQIDTRADVGGFTAAQYRTAIKDLEAYAQIPNPYNPKEKLVNSDKVTQEEVSLKDKDISIEAPDLVMDKTMFESTLKSFDRDYIKNVMQKDMLGTVNSIQKTGVIIKNYTIETDNSVLGEYEYHTLEVKPIDGAASTIRFRLPKVDENGVFKVSNTKYTLRKQRIDVPIRKINSYTTSLTSYYGKTFVTINQKKVNSSLDWLKRQISLAEVTEGSPISSVATINVFDNNFEAPYIYNALASSYKGFKVGKLNFNFSHKERVDLVPPELLTTLEANGGRVAGITDDKSPIVVLPDDTFAIYKNKALQSLGDIYQVLGLPEEKSPTDFADIKVFSKTIPVGVALAYYLGFKKLLALLGVKYRTVEGRKQRNMTPNEYAIIFNDVAYIFNKKDRRNTLILNGFNDYDKQIRRYLASAFDTKDVYFNILDANGIGITYIRELDLLDQMFVDPITKEILEGMNEPVTFKGLLIRGVELLQTFHHPVSQDLNAMRIRGYERFPGLVYKELVGAIRQYKGKNLSGKSKIDISPYQVWRSLLNDPGIKIVEDINPIQNLKETEIVTYVGEGGRTKESMNKSSREYHVSDMGVMSEATVDSTDVGINAYLSANPNFKDMRGMMDKDKKLNPANLLSTSAMLAPASSRDD